MLDLAIGRVCHFCGERTTQNCRVRRQREGAPAEELTVPLCARHQALLRSAGAHGRLHKATGERWWYLSGGLPAAPDEAGGIAGCPVSALLR
jgi:hypothetical protein